MKETCFLNSLTGAFDCMVKEFYYNNQTSNFSYKYNFTLFIYFFF